MTVGDRIRRERELAGISQTDLAGKIKISKQTLYKYEMNIITNIPSDKIEAIAKILNVSPAFLMGWEENLTASNADMIVDLLSDKDLLDNVLKLMVLSKEHQRAIYDNINYWHEKEGLSH